MTRGILLALTLLSSLFVAGQSSNGNRSGSGSVPTGSVVNGIVQTGLMAQYPFTDNSGASLGDTSGNGNNGTLCASTQAPTWIGAPTGGLLFAAGPGTCVTLPAALNSAKTIQIFANVQPQAGNLSSIYACLIAGNGATKANTAAICTNDVGTSTPGFSNLTTYAATVLAGWNNPPNNQTEGLFAPIGTSLTTWVLDATADSLYFGNTLMCSGVANQNCLANAASAGVQTSGVYQLGGVLTYVNGNASYWSGQMYYALFYSTELTAAQIAQNVNAVNQIMQNRGLLAVSGVQTVNAAASTSNMYVVDGDSIPGANGAWFAYAFPSSTYGTWKGVYTGKSGYGIQALALFGNLRDDVWCPNVTVVIGAVTPAGLCVLNVQIGTNNLATMPISTFITQYAQFIAQRRAAGHYSQVWLNTVLDNTGQDANKNTFNTALRENWASMGATGIVDVGADPNLGCDGCAASAVWFTGGIHPTAVGQAEIAHIQQPTINRIAAGNFNFTSANLYTTGAPAATAITAASESTNTVTLTFSATPASFTPGVDLTIAGVTPAGYNTSSSNVCHVLTRTATQITCLNSATGLGAGSVFGTAATPEQLDFDASVRLGGSGTSQQFTLESCASYVGGVNLPNWDGRLRIKNENTTSPWVIVPWASNSETIDGAVTLTMPTASSGNFPIVTLEAQLISSSAGGCKWTRIQ